MTAIRYVLRLKKGGCLFGGLPCSAHVWIASGTTGKKHSCPRGDMTVPATQKGNCLASRFCLLALIAVARQSYWGGEQPGSSVAILLEYVEWLMNCNRCMVGFSPGSTVRLTLDCTHVMQIFIRSHMAFFLEPFSYPRATWHPSRRPHCQVGWGSSELGP
jgi:hypothetical protein